MGKILVTGCAGFIGMHLCKKLLDDDFTVLGIDNLNDYYNVRLKEARLKELLKYESFEFYKVDISQFQSLYDVFKESNISKVVNMAAQAGVRYSLENPHAYIKTNVEGFMNILECCRKFEVSGLVYASSSSVYGGNEKIPFSILDPIKKPISVYAVTKRTNELMAHSYSHLYNLRTTGLRFFTVYGPWGRPDMAMYIFAKKILMKESIQVYNHGDMKRDFTYIDDIVDGVLQSIKMNYKCEIFNLGNSNSENLIDMIGLIENCLGEKAIIELVDMQPGDVKKTYADIKYSENKLGYKPKVSIKQGIPRFIDWYKSWIQV
tara:strand:+ start:1548 stop:2504 length:957 start_codon:yes stop_codon:yes gene_type:complete